MKIAFFGDTHGHINLMYRHAENWYDDRMAELGIRYIHPTGTWLDHDGKPLTRHDGTYGNGQELDYIIQVGDFGFYPTLEGIDRATKMHFDRAGEVVEDYHVDERGDYPAYKYGLMWPWAETYVIRGNHEDQDFLVEQEKEWGPGRPIMMAEDLFYVPDGTLFELGGVVFASLGGNYSHKTFKQGLPRHKQQGRQRNHIDPIAWQKLMDGQDFDVLLTHEAPSGIGMLNRRDPGLDGSPQIRQLIEHRVRRFSFSGHWHHYLEANIGRSHHYSLSKTDPRVERNQSMVVIDFAE